MPCKLLQERTCILRETPDSSRFQAVWLYIAWNIGRTCTIHGWCIATQCFDFCTALNSHLDIQVGGRRDACVVWDGVGGWVLRDNDCRHLPWCEPKHIAVSRNHTLPRESVRLRPGRWLVFTTQYILCARIEQALECKSEPVNYFLGQQVKQTTATSSLRIETREMLSSIKKSGWSCQRRPLLEFD